MTEPMIVCDPTVMMGKPVVAGTRITVELILEKLGSGETFEQLVEAHPRLTRPAILAALDFAGWVLSLRHCPSPHAAVCMNLLADESVDRPIVERLRQEGHAMAYVAELSPSITDDEVLDQANASGALLVTADKDFGELVYRQRRVHAGVILLRLAGMSPAAKSALVAKVMQHHGTEMLGAFSVVSPGAVRVRQPTSPGAPITKWVGCRPRLRHPTYSE